MKHKIRKSDSAVIRLLKELENIDPMIFQGEITRLMKLSKIIKECLEIERKHLQKAYNDGYSTLDTRNFKKYYNRVYKHTLSENYENN